MDRGQGMPGLNPYSFSKDILGFFMADTAAWLPPYEDRFTTSFMIEAELCDKK